MNRLVAVDLIYSYGDWDDKSLSYVQGYCGFCLYMSAMVGENRLVR